MIPSAEDSNVVLNVTSRMKFLPVVTSFVEQAARAISLGKKEALALTLAAEEIFTYLCHLTASSHNLKIWCMDMGYGVRTKFIFAAADFPLQVFNLTASISIDEDTSPEEMGLLIASRSVDRFEFFGDDTNSFHLLLIKEKSYPEIPLKAAVPVPALAQCEIVQPDADNLKVFADRVLQHYPEILTPRVCRYPGKLVDMVSSGNMQAALATDPSGTIGAGILWAFYNSRIIECFGPFVFNQPAAAAISEALLETCLGNIAHASAVVLINRFPTPEIPPGYFELLGSLNVQTSSVVTERYVCFRQLKEDPGALIWGHTDIEDFLRREYERLSLPRKIRMFQDAGETQNTASVLSTVFDRARRRVNLRPVRSGADMVQNIKRHIQFLQKESAAEIFFEIDTGRSWQPAFVPALLQNGFKPKLLVPYGGSADMIIFQWGPASS